MREHSEEAHVLHRMNSVEALQRFNAEWQAKLQNKPGKEETSMEGFRIVGPDGDDVELSEAEVQWLEIEGVIVRTGKRIKLAPGMTVDDLCGCLNVG